MGPERTPTEGRRGVERVPPDAQDMRLDRWLRRRFPALSNGQLQKLLRMGQIRLEGKRTQAAVRLSTGQQLRLPPSLLEGEAGPSPRRAAMGKRPLRRPDVLTQWILYQDDDVIALNKPAGLAVQGGTGLKENLDDSLMTLSLDGKTRPKLVHRLDRETSGVLLIARNDFAARKLTDAFRSRAARKIYWAVTAGVPTPAEGLIETPLVKRGERMAIPRLFDRDLGAAKEAATFYRVVESVPGKLALVVLWPLTGRTHQLRVHLAHKGAPIWKDPFYGLIKEQEEALGLAALALGTGLHLHARRLILPHPRQGVLDVRAPLGANMKKTWRCLGFPEPDGEVFESIGRKDFS